ncbi:CAMK family protein kinase [Tritrichomonas foetus]|uniref:CAMK family protein kinase n=1 Tax=Tritrichomonas foetus TaxID=1144522 RepID=A0A1J4JQI2_9EUKA|nr:CAMK family protein kinase [Tritrichomonas foetus]|eukprot:OHT01423.1 CAMK family protein kinase [Tritrichomonas foetus]
MSKDKENIELKEKLRIIENHLQTFNYHLFQNSDIYARILVQNEIDHYQRIRIIGSTGISEVFQVYNERDFALKIIHIHSHIQNDNNKGKEKEADKGMETYDNNKIKRFLSEYEKMSRIIHPNVLKTYGICYGDENHHPSLLLEYCSNNLKSCVSTFTNEDANRVIIEICSGMAYIHQCGVIHGNLKPENILINHDKHVKICDFGISTLSAEITHVINADTLAYMSPEQHFENKCSNQSDVFAFGLIMLFILTRGYPPKISLIDIILNKDIQFPSDTTTEFQNIIRSCLSGNPEERPSFLSLYNSLTSGNVHLISE